MGAAQQLGVGSEAGRVCLHLLHLPAPTHTSLHLLHLLTHREGHVQAQGAGTGPHVASTGTLSINSEYEQNFQELFDFMRK